VTKRTKKNKAAEPRTWEVPMRITKDITVFVEAVDATEATMKAEALDTTSESAGEVVDWEVTGSPSDCDA
jgi:hypothetical protein